VNWEDSCPRTRMAGPANRRLRQISGFNRWNG
jgi:hypothetical protein